MNIKKILRYLSKKFVPTANTSLRSWVCPLNESHFSLWNYSRPKHTFLTELSILWRQVHTPTARISILFAFLPAFASDVICASPLVPTVTDVTWNRLLRSHDALMWDKYLYKLCHRVILEIIPCLVLVPTSCAFILIYFTSKRRLRRSLSLARKITRQLNLLLFSYLFLKSPFLLPVFQIVSLFQSFPEINLEIKIS